MATASSDPASARVALVIGAGDSTGGAIAKRFAREGYVACVTRRTADKLQPLVDEIRAAGGQAHGFASDARKEEDVVALVEQIERDIGPISVRRVSRAPSPHGIPPCLTASARRASQTEPVTSQAGTIS